MYYKVSYNLLLKLFKNNKDMSIHIIYFLKAFEVKTDEIRHS